MTDDDRTNERGRLIEFVKPPRPAISNQDASQDDYPANVRYVYQLALWLIQNGIKNEDLYVDQLRSAKDAGMEFDFSITNSDGSRTPTSLDSLADGISVRRLLADDCKAALELIYAPPEDAAEQLRGLLAQIRARIDGCLGPS